MNDYQSKWESRIELLDGLSKRNNGKNTEEVYKENRLFIETLKSSRNYKKQTEKTPLQKKPEAPGPSYIRPPTEISAEKTENTENMKKAKEKPIIISKLGNICQTSLSQIKYKAGMGMDKRLPSSYFHPSVEEIDRANGFIIGLKGEELEKFVFYSGIKGGYSKRINMLYDPSTLQEFTINSRKHGGFFREAAAFTIQISNL
ncbi:MAG: hypothetical protein ISS95_00420 [Candidatus Aenigmarchaeota archaeon]|nr:hypothetical protein [Candidatus Aenigmarchaeota archaeon]